MLTRFHPYCTPGADDRWSTDYSTPAGTEPYPAGPSFGKNNNSSVREKTSFPTSPDDRDILYMAYSPKGVSRRDRHHTPDRRLSSSRPYENV